MMRAPLRHTPRHPRYAVVRRLGSGGSGSVYLARDLLDDSREVALKVCHGDIAPEQLLREFRILRELRHPGIARAFDFGRLPEGGSTYFTLEYVPGPDLEKQSAAFRRLSPGGTAGPLLDLFLQITDSLTYLHRKGLLHLDLKPANVVISSGQAKLIDFGLFQNAALRDRRQAKGTAYFTAPEVFEEGPIDRRTDLYSLGVTMYRSFTGRYPIRGRSLQEISENHRRLPPRPPRGLADGLARIILKLLAKSPQHRFQSAEEVALALHELQPAGSCEPRAPSFEGLDFAGRKQELDQFFGWFDDLRKGKGPGVFSVGGESGSGKSRFAEACTTEMLSTGTQVVPLRCFGGPGQDGLRRMVEKVLVLYPLSNAERSRSRFLLTNLGIRADRSSLAELKDLSLDQIRARVFQEAIDLLARSASPALVVVIEDCHRADEQLKDFVRRLTEGWTSTDGPPRRVGIFATYRTGEARAGLLAPAKGPCNRFLSLGPLNRSAILEALRDCKSPGSSGEGARLASLSRGNPGLLSLFLRRRNRRGGETRASSAAEVGEVFRGRLGGLDADAWSLALALVLLERPADQRLLEDVCGMTAGRIRIAITRLEEVDLVRCGPIGYYIDEDLIEEARLHCSPEAVRTAHERIGLRFLEEPRRVREAAHHLLRAGRLDEGVRAAEKAGRELRDAGRVEEAAQVYSEAIEHAATHSSRFLLLEALGDTQERCGKFDDAEGCYDRVLAETALPPADRLRLLRKLGGIRQRRGDTQAAHDSFEGALALLDRVDDIEEHLHVYNELAALHLFRGELSQSATFANRGLEILGSNAASLSREAHAYHSLNFHSAAGHILLRQFEYQRAAKEFLHGLELAEKIRSLSNAARILNNLGIAYHQANRLREALAVYHRATTLAQKMGDITAMFSIRCNLAHIRARLGEIRAAEEILSEVQGMPHARLSKRAHLILLYTLGLVSRLSLRDARRAWIDCIRLADELPDPLLASSGRLCLLENEIYQGRWASARQVLGQIETARVAESRLDRAVSVRRAYLDALCGHRDAACTLLDSRVEEKGDPDHAALWENVLTGAALIEVGETARAEMLLEATRKLFERSRQPSGSLQCSLLLVEASLRARDPGRALEGLGAVARSIQRHDTGVGSRCAAALVPYLEARAALQAGKSPASVISERLEKAFRNLEEGSSPEMAWLLSLVAVENGEPGAARKLRAARLKFVRGLTPEDRKSYLARDHRVRLGLSPPGAGEGSRAATSHLQLRRYEALLRLKQLKDPRVMFLTLMHAAGAEHGAFFLDGEPRVAAVEGLGARRGRALEELRTMALRTGLGRVASGVCAEVRPCGGRRAGVLYIEKPDSPDDKDLASFLETAGQILGGVLASSPDVSRKRLSTSPALLSETTRTRSLTVTSFITSESPRMRELATLVERTRESLLPILLTGESGVGKDHLARWIHSLGPRRKGPFVAQDFAAIPPGLLEAEIFGYEAGAFTGASQAKVGLLPAARGGTFYLDNVDSTPLEVQGKLLRVLQGDAVRPLGGSASGKLDVRFIASSQRDLKDLCARGELRKDLYFRLSGICLIIPPLRERAEDIPLLVQHFRSQIRGGGPEFSPAAMEALKSHNWPGNVRELESAVRRLALTSEGSVDQVQVARVLGIEGARFSFPRWIFEGRSYDQTLEDVKREYLLYLYEDFEGDIDRIAKELGLTKRNVYLRFSQAGIRPFEDRGTREGP